MTTSDNQNIHKNKNRVTISLGNYETILKNIYEIYHPKNKSILELKHCEDILPYSKGYKLD